MKSNCISFCRSRVFNYWVRNGCYGASKMRKNEKLLIVYQSHWALSTQDSILKFYDHFSFAVSNLPISIEKIWFNDDAYHKLRVAPYEIRLICFGAFSPCSRDWKWIVKSIIIRPLHLSNGTCDRVSLSSRGLRGKFPIIYYYLLNSIASRVSRICRRLCAESQRTEAKTHRGVDVTARNENASKSKYFPYWTHIVSTR